MNRRLLFLLLCTMLCMSCQTLRTRTSGKKETVVSTTLPEEEQRKYEYYFLEAVRLRNSKDYAAAFEMLQYCRQLNPQAASLHYELSQYYIMMKQVPTAVKCMEQAVGLEPDNYWYCQALVNLYMQQDEGDKATALLEQMTERFPYKYDIMYTLFDIYSRNEDYDKAVKMLDELERRTEKSEMLTMQKFRIYQQMKDSKKAFREIESLVTEYPHDLRYQVVLGDAYLQEGNTDEALKIYQQVLKKEPRNPLAMYSMANYYEQTGQKERYEKQLDSLLLSKGVDTETKQLLMRQYLNKSEQQQNDSVRVIALFEKTIASDPEDSQMLQLYVQYLLAKKMNQRAIPVLKQIVAVEPTNSAARMMILGEAVKANDYNEVINLCEGGVEATPDMIEFYFYLAVGYSQAKRTDEVLETCKKALTHVTTETPKELISDFYSIIGDSYHTKKMNQEAYAAYDSSLVYNPNNIPSLNNYAYYLSVERRDLDKAEEMSYKTIKAEPNNGTYLDTYAWILFEKGDYAQARIYIDMAMKNDGDKSADVVEHCGDIYAKTEDDISKAVEYWKKALQMGSESKTLKRKIAQKKYIPE